MQAIILCGGLGTRLRKVIGETQKTMVRTSGTPFLVNIINYLKSYDITDVIFSIGYKGSEVKKYFGDDYFFGVSVHYAEEKEPLGTGGAIRNSLELINGDKVLVLNGDTLFPVNINDLEENFSLTNSDLSIACKELSDKTRYGTIMIDKNSNLITEFLEKVDDKKFENDDKLKGKYSGTVINGGVYLMKKSLIKTIETDKNISLENELIPKWISEKKIVSGIVSNADFIDIGTPESLELFKERKSRIKK